MEPPLMVALVPEEEASSAPRNVTELFVKLRECVVEPE